MGHRYPASRGHLYLAAILCDCRMCVMEHNGGGVSVMEHKENVTPFVKLDEDLV